MKPIYSVVIYEQDTENGEIRFFAKCPCTSEKAAIAYAKILEKWWDKPTKIEKDYPITIAAAKKLEELPF